MARIKKSIVINAPVEKVYAIARDPHRRATWYVGLSEPDRVTGNSEVGTVVEHAFLMADVHFPVTTTILEDHGNPEGSRWRAKNEGALAGEARWTYTPKDGGTEVTSETEYTVPGKALGKLADRLLIERMNARAMEDTLANMKLVCDAE